MSLVYVGTNGLFTHLGKLVKHYHQFKVDATAAAGLDADRLDILDTFLAADQDVAIDGLVGAFERWKDEYVKRREELAGFAQARMRDRITVLQEIGAASTDQSEILHKLIKQMKKDGETVEASQVSISPVLAWNDNQGGGTILTTNVLDGSVSPGVINGLTMPSHPDYNGHETELTCPSETFLFRVTADSYHDQLEEGSEEITWEGDVPDDLHGIDTEGSGFVVTFQPIHAVTSQYLRNADFEEGFVNGVPTGWDLVAGVGEVNVSAAAVDQAFHGDQALLLAGNGSASSIELKQDVDPTSVIATRRYCVTAQLKKENAVTGTLTIKFAGTGYAELSVEKIVVPVASLTTDYQLHHFFLNMPAIIPDDFRLIIRWDGGTPDAGEKVYVDDLAIGPVQYGGGIGVVAVRNTGPFVRDDTYNVSVSNVEGVFQGFFRRVFGVQLPSAVGLSGSLQATIPDSLTE